jgi:hypothetical protein
MLPESYATDTWHVFVVCESVLYVLSISSGSFGRPATVIKHCLQTYFSLHLYSYILCFSWTFALFSSKLSIQNTIRVISELNKLVLFIATH